MVHPLLRLAPLLRPTRGLLVAASVGLLVSTGLSLAGPWLVREAIDGAIGGEDLDRLYQVAGLYLFVVLLNMAVHWGARAAATRVAQDTLLRLKRKLFGHLVDHDLAFHDKHTSGRLITRVQGDPDSLHILFTEVLISAPGDVVLFAGMFAILIAYSPTVALVVAAVLPPYLIAFLVFRKVSPPIFLAVREESARLTGFLTEHVRALPMLQLHDRGAWAREACRERNRTLYVKDVKAQIAPTVFFNTLFGIRGVGFAVVLWAGGLEVAEGEATVGVLVMALGYLRQMFNPLMRISHSLTTIERARAAAIRIAGILDSEPAVTSGDRPWPGLREALALEAVDFAYDPGTPVLQGIDLRIPAGARVGVVGATGSGKSTLVNLLLRFRDPTAGRVTIDGTDLRELDLAQLRRSVGLVLQDVHLFAGTVLDNLGGDRDAARAALATLELDFDLDQPLEAGARNLSRGERQLLTFARALVRNPEILVLDEATSAVDPATEGRVQEALERLQTGRTSITVAHRLATVRHCDRIVVLHHGRVAESGTHDELVALGGLYAALYQLQHGAAA